ncbi:enoyl-CoA hydratase-related protein [Desulfuribacillus stibiiarsenatis]|uniref:enoyl-CoA hydratase-related protein n=1 Tax=Desulfuribacillus stibiiarsenatis TaxID=1390249 RepID=UPI000B31DCFB|nr:enoyl-CoA hydratase-related protein [Desulfuribacillus stibiiarsenatis]
MQLSTSSEKMLEAAERFNPSLIIAPFLKEYIPDQLWMRYKCIIVHPGVKGDRGPSSLDWAILNGKKLWGVTLLEASPEMDAGDIWATHNFPVRNASKSALYRKEGCDAAIKGLLDTIEKFESGTFKPTPLDYSHSDTIGILHTPMKQLDRAINWHEPTSQIARKIRCADSQPGVLDTINGQSYYLYGVHEESKLKGAPGDIIAKRDGAICRATGDGAVWISHLKKKPLQGELSCKLPAEMVLQDQLDQVPSIALSPFDSHSGSTYREIFYHEKNEVGYLQFNFYNGAMSTEQCYRLRDAYQTALSKNTKVLVLLGGQDFWSNGIHLNVIEASPHPGHESWRNINAIDDLVRDIILTDSKIVISALQGNAAAGGVIMALASDYVFARDGIILNPHYKKMGLYGSEYWTYLLPSRVGTTLTSTLTESCLPLSTRKAKAIGLIDVIYDSSALIPGVKAFVEHLVASKKYEQLLKDKQIQRKLDEQIKPLEDYRNEELSHMWDNFFSISSTYHTARKQFVYKLSCVTAKSCSGKQ